VCCHSMSISRALLTSVSYQLEAHSHLHCKLFQLRQVFHSSCLSSQLRADLQQNPTMNRSELSPMFTFMMEFTKPERRCRRRLFPKDEPVVRSRNSAVTPVDCNIPVDIDELPRGPQRVRRRYPLLLVPSVLMEKFVDDISELLRAARIERYQHPLESPG